MLLGKAGDPAREFVLLLAFLGQLTQVNQQRGGAFITGCIALVDMFVDLAPNGLPAFGKSFKPQCLRLGVYRFPPTAFNGGLFLDAPFACLRIPSVLRRISPAVIRLPSDLCSSCLAPIASRHRRRKSSPR
jgi:hypothetical protein